MSRQLTPFETVMLRAEVDPMLRSTGVLFEILDRVPDRQRLRAAHEWGSRLLVPLRHRVLQDPLGIAPARWVVDRDFDLDYHLRFVSLPAPGSLEQALAFAQQMGMAPFDLARPLWEAVLLEGFDGDRAIYLLKLHHSITDGQGAVAMLDLLHSEAPEPGRATPLPVPAPEAQSPGALALRSALGLPRTALAQGLKLGLASAGLGVRVARRPTRLAQGARYLASLNRMLGPPPAPGSVLLQQRSLSRRFALREVPVADLKAAGRSVGGTLNDALLAGLARAVAHYHREHGVALEELTVAFPVSLRRPEDPPGSNRFAGARIAVPATEIPVPELVRLVGERSRAVQGEPALGFLDALAPAMSRLPGSVLASLTGQVTRSIDLQVSNVKGLARTAYLAGAEVERTFAFGPAPGPATMVTLLSYRDTCCLALTMNAAAIPDHERFLACVDAGLADVLALAADPVIAGAPGGV